MKLLFFVTVDWYFCSHRLPLAVAAKEAGYDVVVVTQVQDHGELISNAGLRVVPLNCSRRSMNPLSELGVVVRLVRIYRQERPDIVHHVAMKPVLYGSIAARVAGVTRVVNALTGMGYVFSSGSRLARALMPTVRGALRVLLRRGRVIVQNQDDAALVRSLGLDNLAVIRGSGVDPRQFTPAKAEPPPPPVVMLVSRLLWDKGVGEFVEAARQLRAQGVYARFVLVGAPDAENRASVDQSTLDAWTDEGAVEWWGRQDDVPSVLAQAHVACLPSYREGIPKSLIEAASCGLPIVTTDTPGCREIVVDGDSGLLVPPRDPEALAAALGRFPGERSDVLELMRAMDVLCSSSSWGEGFPNVLGEAMACGVPCVATDVGDSAEIVGDTGIVVPPSDSEALLQGLMAMLGKASDERDALGRAARSRVGKKFGLKTVVGQYADLYQMLVKRG